MKIAAAELWRKYSENYKGHQARYPNPKSKYRGKGTGNPDDVDYLDTNNHGNNEDSQDLEETSPKNVNCDTDHLGSGSENTDSLVLDKSDRLAEKTQNESGGDPQPANGSNDHQGEESGDMGVLYIDDSRTSNDEGVKDMSQRPVSGNMVSTEDRARTESTTSSNGRGRSESNVSVLSTESDVISTSLASSQASYSALPRKNSSPVSQLHSPGSRSDIGEMTSRDDSELLKSDSRLSPGFPQRERSQSCIEIGRGIAAHQIGVLPGLGVPHGAIPVSLGSTGVVPSMPGMMLQQGGVFIPALMPGYPALHDLSSIYPASSSSGPNASRRSASISAPGTPASSGSSTPTPEQGKKTLVFRSSEYKKSERGLSFLFPSLADQQLSLLDKVRITVLRHKHNYFLGWPEEVLQQLDPLVRPKMVVTRQLYKEYCHRNAMKYDSNLQFALESTEVWADDFRGRLTKPPSEGGFHSLCEVKQEAGRLWREYSGRYKMHNVVKSQMDLNSEVSSIYLEGDLKEDFSSRAKQKMGESGDILTDPTTRARPRAISDLTDDRSMRYRSAYLQGAAAAHRLDFSPESLSNPISSSGDYQRCRSPLNVSVGEEPCNISRRSSYVTSEESVSQGRSANSSPSPSSRSALSSPGPQPPAFISTAGVSLVTSRSANSSPLNVSLSCTLTTSGSRAAQHAQLAATDTTGSPHHHPQVQEAAFRLDHRSRKRSFEMSSVGQESTRGEGDSPTKAKASRISIDSSDSRSPKDVDSTSDISSFDKLSRKRSSGTSIESSKSEYEHSSYGKDLSPTRSPPERTPRKHGFDQPMWDDDMANTETLFKPLPGTCSVSEQLGIWMQRHRHNYFRNYNAEDLLQVQPRVRPQYLVSPEIYRRFISENMVSMFGKVNEILQSDTPWATNYQTRVDQAPVDGGFNTIEEALTEALDLWAKYVEGGKDKQKDDVSGIPPGWKHKREKAMERTSTPDGQRERSATMHPESSSEPPMEEGEGIARERSSSWPQDPQFAFQKASRKGHHTGRIKSSVPTAWQAPLYTTTPNLGSVGFLPTVGEFKVKQETPSETDDPAYDPAAFSWAHSPYRYPTWESAKRAAADAESTASSASSVALRRMASVDRNTPDLSTEALDLRRATPEAGSHASDLQIRSAAQLSRQLWGCRPMLQKVLSEDPSASWHSRLAQYLPRLQAQLGPNYACPTSTADCMIDLLLATLDQQLSKL